MHIPSIFGNKYIMNFIDDYIRLCWVYLLKHKSQAFETFKNFHVWIENEAQTSIRTLLTDNGRGCNCNEFETNLRQHRIKHETIVPYNPRKNGVAKRMIKTLWNMLRLMLFFKKFVKCMLCANTVLCVVYVRNGIPSHALGNKTPYEMCNGRISSMRHIRVFGSTYYDLIPEEKRNKLGARS